MSHVGPTQIPGTDRASPITPNKCDRPETTTFDPGGAGRKAGGSNALPYSKSSARVFKVLAPSTSLCVTRIVLGQPRASESRTQYVSPSKEIHDTVGMDPSGPDSAEGLERVFGLTR